MLLITDVTSAIEQRIAAELAARRDLAEPGQAVQRSADDVARMATQLDHVTEVNRQLVAANQDLGGADLELQRVTDDLLLAREQEQASVEEIRTLNEELQASNEELETVNEELEATVEELRISNDNLAARNEEIEELVRTAERQRQAAEAEAARQAAILLSMGDAVLVVGPDAAPLLINEAYPVVRRRVRPLGGARRRWEAAVA
jgi:two-component system CheB/CheR fusion protein